jgi:hypothetical protein
MARMILSVVEIDSSFYRPPNLFMTKRWASITPDNFRFAAKFPRSITHEKKDCRTQRSSFAISLMSCVHCATSSWHSIQLPPSLTAKEGLKSLGLQIVAPRESAIGFALKEMGTITDARLKEGEDKRFKEIGFQLGTELFAKRIPSA